MNNNPNILIVDDQSENLALLCSVLKNEGYNTFPADSGELALASLENNIPDLMLLDIQMSGMDGFELCKRIKQTDELSKIPIIFLTVATELEEKLEGFRLGAVDYVTKPFQEKELLIRVRTHVDLFTFQRRLQEQNHEIASLNEKYLATIEELSESEKRIKISEERFITMFKEAPLGIALIDSITGQIFEINAKSAQIAGRTVKEMTTIDWMSITHPDDIQEQLNNMVLLNAGDIKGFHMEKRYLKPDNTIVWINMTIAPISNNYEGNPRHLCMIEDITKRKHVTEELEQHKINLEEMVRDRTKELEKKNEELERYNHLFLGRELRIKELRTNIKELKNKLSEK